MKLHKGESEVGCLITPVFNHTDDRNIATLTAFVPADNEKRIYTKKHRSGNKNRAANKKLTADLKKLGYSFTRVDGKYRQIGQSEPISGVSYFIICPEGFSLDMFTKDMINLACKYEQEAVVVWDYLEQKGVLYGRDDFRNYKKWETFNKFTITGVNDSVWTQFKKHHLTFGIGNEDYVVTNIQNFDSDLDVTTPVFRISHFRKEMFGEWY